MKRLLKIQIYEYGIIIDLHILILKHLKNFDEMFQVKMIGEIYSPFFLEVMKIKLIF
jgi:hypothetical protein